jgi:hypothetical protein
VVDVILSSDNVTVLGGPSNLEVDLNIGASGTRGSLFFIGTQNPNTLNPNQDFPSQPILFDIFINVNIASEDYLQAYQLTNQDGINTWIPTFKLSQNTYSANKVIEFIGGEASVNIEIASIGLDAVPFDESSSNSFSYFGVQASLTNVDLDDPSSIPLPSAMSFKVGNAIFDSNGSEDSGQFPSFLPVTFSAVEFDGEGWSPINKKTYVSVIVSYVNPNEIFENIDLGGDE